VCNISLFQPEEWNIKMHPLYFLKQGGVTKGSAATLASLEGVFK
jgi:hypothetical protein